MAWDEKNYQDIIGNCRGHFAHSLMMTTVFRPFKASRKTQWRLWAIIIYALLLLTTVLTANADAMQSSRGVAVNFSEYPEYVDRWAVIVGITDYKDDRLELKYAHRDAEELYKLIRTPSAGAYAEDHVLKLVNEDATTLAITHALRTFLKKPAKEDIVLIFFAAHGMADPDRPDNIYLLTHDTNPDDISGTALPMREIQASLR